MPQTPMWTRAERASAAASAHLYRLTPEKFLSVEVAENRRLVAVEHGVSTEEWVAELLVMDEALTAIEEGHAQGDSAGVIAARVPVPQDGVAKVIALLDQEANPAKDRGPDAQIRAQALAFQLKVSMRTAWKYYDEANDPSQPNPERDLLNTIKKMCALGLSDQRIADEAGGTGESIGAILDKYGRP